MGIKEKHLNDKDEYDLLLACVLGEAEGEPLLGKLAVACVVRNRVINKRWPDNYKDVLLQYKQFSCFLPQYLRPEIFVKQRQDPAWRECNFAAFGVYHDWIQDVTLGSNHYYATTLNNPPSWAEGKHPVLRMGGHIFFKL
ncbi:MAG: cell wall hydrolase [Syntrophaceae bacterium]|nr:cell wall hydrolase [Syntrophaceae bacterium]